MAWNDFWAWLGDRFDPNFQRDERARERDQLDADLVGSGGGNFDGAGTGGQD